MIVELPKDRAEHVGTLISLLSFALLAGSVIRAVLQARAEVACEAAVQI